MKLVQEYSRIDLAPELTRSVSLPFLQLSPKALVRYTRYGASLDENGDLKGPALDRQFFEGTVEARGPKLFRIFRLPGDFYSEKFKHTFEPEFLYTYRSKVEAFDSLPSFDYSDQYPGTNQIRYGLTNSIHAKRMGPAGKLVTHELLSWRLSQTYYFDISQNPAPVRSRLLLRHLRAEPGRSLAPLSHPVEPLPSAYPVVLAERHQRIQPGLQAVHEHFGQRHASTSHG